MDRIGSGFSNSDLQDPGPVRNGRPDPKTLPYLPNWWERCLLPTMINYILPTLWRALNQLIRWPVKRNVERMQPDLAPGRRHIRHPLRRFSNQSADKIWKSFYSVLIKNLGLQMIKFNYYLLYFCVSCARPTAGSSFSRRDGNQINCPRTETWKQKDFVYLRTKDMESLLASLADHRFLIFPERYLTAPGPLGQII